LPPGSRGKDFFILKGGESTLAISKERKRELVEEYVAWINTSRAMILTDYLGLDMKDIDELRKNVREAGGEFHIVKNTLGKIAFEEAGLELPEHYLEGTTAIGFAFEDAPGLAKAFSQFAKDSDFLTIKGGYLDKRMLTAAEIQALAELPPLDVMRAQLLGTIMAPASKLVRTLAEPARALASVIRAYSEESSAETAESPA
jgi:large subunit ribosomal protein L10